MRTYCVYLVFLICNRVASLDTYEDFNVIHVEQNVGADVRFPEELLINFNYYGNDVSLLLSRDDETTRKLNEFIFETSSFLPSGVYSSKHANDFSAYVSNGATIIAHRENATVPCKMYGRFTLNDERMLMSSEEGSHFLHRVVREAEVDREDVTVRQKRDITTNVTNLVELSVFTDFSVYDFWSTSVMVTSDEDDITLEMGDWLRSLIRDVDTLFHKVADYSSVDIRVYMQDYQIATTLEQSPWVEGALSESTIQTHKALKSMAEYYQNLVDKFSFPDTDHIMVLTKYDFDNGEQFDILNSMCDQAPQRSVSYVNTNYYIKAMAQAIAKSMGVRMDGPPDSPCESGDCFVMSPEYGPVSDAMHENPWKFSLCSVLDIQDFCGNDQSSCLRQNNNRMDFDNFMTFPPFGLKYSPTQQCQTNFGSASAFCTLGGGTGVAERSACYSEREGCMVGGVCVNHQFGDFTPCDTGVACRYGTCVNSVSQGSFQTTTFLPSSSLASSIAPTVIPSSTADPSTTERDRKSSTTTTQTTTTTPQTTTTTPQTTTTTPQTTTTEGGRMSSSTPSPSCVVDFGFEEITLPGCGCCGGCGCDVNCDSCPDGLGRPAFTLNSEVCNITDNCCPGKIRIQKSFIPADCPVTVIPDDQTLVIDKKGWEVTDIDVNAIAKPTGDGGWTIRFE